ncbi:MAG: TRAM domain-containing protein [Phycisphaerales bacterium]
MTPPTRDPDATAAGSRVRSAASRAINPIEAADRQRRLLLRIVRVAFVILFAVLTGLSLIGAGIAEPDAPLYWPYTLAIAVGVFGVIAAADLLTPTKKISTVVSVVLGLLAAMLATAAIGFVFDLLASTWDMTGYWRQLLAIAKILIGTGLAYLAIATVLQTQDDFRLVIPYVEFAKQMRGTRPLLLDSSAIIDARIVEVGATGLIQSPVIIPGFVVGELQLLADSADKLTRAKGRRGLEVISRLQRTATLDVSIDETPIPGKAVDQMLVELARRLSGIVATNDVALARIAEIQGVPVLNINDLANALKPSVIPGEALRLKILKPGEQPGQGVGYLDDGTMVVAEDGQSHIGSVVELQVTSTLQTSAGRLIFGRIDLAGHAPPTPAHAESVGVHEEAVEDTPHAPPPRVPRPSPPRGASSRNPRR